MLIHRFNGKYIFRETGTMHGSLIVGIESRLSVLEDKLSDVDARASEEADCSSNERDLDRFIYSGRAMLSVYLLEQLDDTELSSLDSHY